MMKHTLTLLLATAMLCSTTGAIAAPPDDKAPDNVPPAHQQKNSVPDSNQNGNYLEQQPDNNNDTGKSVSGTNHQGTNKPSKAGNMEKSKRFHQKPEDGGTGVKQP